MIFHFTRRQMEEHDAAVRRDYKKALEQKLLDKLKEQQDVFDKHIQDEWAKRREEFGESGTQDRFGSIMSYMMTIGAAVLIEEFHWTPINVHRKPAPNHRILRWADRVAEVVQEICEDEMKDIRTYCDQVYEKYGVRFRWGIEEEKHE